MIKSYLKSCVRSYRFKRNFGLSRSEIKKYLDENVDDPNFFMIKDERDFKENLKVPDSFIIKHISKDAKVYECSCGVGSNLLYLANNGFKNFYGSDIDQSYLDAAQYLFRLHGTKLETWIEDSLKFDSDSKVHAPFDLILSFYWSHVVSGFSFEKFLAQTYNLLSQGGYLIFEAVDDSYDKYENQEFNINDFDLPKDQRRPTQFINRINNKTFENEILKCGYEIVLNHLTQRKVPKRVFILRKV